MSGSAAPGAWPPPPGAPAAGAGRAGLLLLLFAAALYVGTLQHEFVWDDHHTVVHNQYLTHSRHLPTLLSADVTRLTGGSLHGVYYRPLFWLSLMLDYRLWGLTPAGFYLTNLLLYALACLLLLCLLRELLPRTEAALLAALLFAAHPAHVESVAWVSGRCDTLPAVAGLAAVWLYLRGRRAAGWRAAAAQAGSLLGTLAALLAKESAAALPAILLWLEVVLPATPPAPRRRRGAAALGRLAPHFLILALYLAFRAEALLAWSLETAPGGSLGQRLPGALELIARYTLLALVPVGVQPVYALARPESLLAPWPAAGGLLLLALGWAAWRARPGWPVVSFGLGWFLLGLGPVLDLVPLSARPLSFAARHLFLPGVGLCLVLGQLLAVLLADRREAGRPAGASPLRARATLALAALVGIVFAGQSLWLASRYASDLALFTRVAQQEPGLALGHQNLGLALLRAGRPAEALAALERAVAAEPDNPRVALVLAGAHLQVGRLEAGQALLDRIAPRLGRQVAFVQVQAAAHFLRGEWDAAARLLERSLQLHGATGDLHALFGYALEQSRDLAGAAAAYRRALDRNPGSLEARVGLARISLRAGRPGEGLAAAREALAHAPAAPAALRILALALEASGQPEEARVYWAELAARATTPAQRREALQHLGPPTGAGRPGPGGAP